MAINVEENIKKKIIGFIITVVPNATIYLYGSRARGTNSEWSDIDIAVDAGERMPQLTIGEIRDVLDASNMPYIVDVVDLNSIDEARKKEILKEKITWRGEQL